MRRLRPESVTGADRRNLRYWSSILVLSKDVTDRTKNVLRELFTDECIRIEFVTPLERGDHHVGRVLHVELPIACLIRARDRGNLNAPGSEELDEDNADASICRWI